MAILVGASWVLDLRLLGLGRNVPLPAFRWVFRAVAVGLTINVITGALLFAARATQWGTSLPFLIKIVLVIAAASTLLPLRRDVLHGAAETQRTRLFAIASLALWAAAVTAGRLLAYVTA